MTEAAQPKRQGQESDGLKYSVPLRVETTKQQPLPHLSSLICELLGIASDSLRTTRLCSRGATIKPPRIGFKIQMLLTYPSLELFANAGLATGTRIRKRETSKYKYYSAENPKQYLN